MSLACKLFGVLGLLAACGGEAGREVGAPDGPSNCAIALEVQAELVAALRASSPTCESDDDCVHVDTAIEAAGASVRACGDVLHREAAAGWDPVAAAVLVEMRLQPSEFSCEVQPSCAATRPLCASSGRCEAEAEE